MTIYYIILYLCQNIKLYTLNIYNVICQLYFIKTREILSYNIWQLVWLHSKSIWTMWEKARVGWYEGMALKHVSCEIDDQGKFHAWSRALKASALGQPRGLGWGGRWAGGSGWGDTCAPVADSCRCLAKPIQYCGGFILIFGKTNTVM